MLSAVNKPFFMEVDVVEFLICALDVRDPRELAHTLERDFRKASETLKGDCGVSCWRLTDRYWIFLLLACKSN